MHKHYNDGPAAVKQAREAEANKQVERMTSMMVWMTYGWIIAAGVFLRAAGWMQGGGRKDEEKENNHMVLLGW